MLPPEESGRRRRIRLRLTWGLMAAWLVVTFGVSFFARSLGFSVWGWPISFWMASQGALLIYCLIVWFYARTMNRLDAPDEEAGEALTPSHTETKTKG